MATHRAGLTKAEPWRDALEANLIAGGRSPAQASGVTGAMVAGGRCPTCGRDISLASRSCRTPERAARFIGGCPIGQVEA